MKTTTKPTRRGINCYLVTNPETHGGGSMRGDSPRDAARRAARHSGWRGVKRFKVKFFAGPVVPPLSDYVHYFDRDEVRS